MAILVGFIVLIVIAILFPQRDEDLSKDVVAFLSEHEHHDQADSEEYETWDN